MRQAAVRVRLVAVSLGLAVLAALPAAPAAAQSVRERELTSSGAWSWFGDPAASTSTAPTAAPTPAGCRPAAASRWAATTTTPACGRSPPSRPASRSTTTSTRRSWSARRPAAGVLVDPCRRQHVVPALGPARGHHRLGAGARLPHYTLAPTATPTPTRCSCRARATASTCSGGAALQPVVLDLQQRHQLERGPDADPELASGPTSSTPATAATPSPCLQPAHPRSAAPTSTTPTGRVAAPGRRVGHHQHGQPAHHPGPGGAGPQLADQRQGLGHDVAWTTPGTW